MVAFDHLHLTIVKGKEMKVTVTIECQNNEEFQAVASKLMGAAPVEMNYTSTDESAPAAEPKKRGRKPKETAAPAAATTDDIDDLLGGTDAAANSSEADLDLGLGDIPEAAPAPVLTLENVITALKDFCIKHPRKLPQADAQKEAEKLLMSFGVNSIRKLPAEKYAEFISKLK